MRKLTCVVGDALGAALTVELLDVPQVPKPVWHPSPQ
jgi:hypothetical protein